MLRVGDVTGNPGEFAQTLDLGDRAVTIVDSLGRIDLDNLRDEIEETGAVVVFYGSLAARARRNAKTLRYQARQYEATVAKEARAEAKARGDRITDPGVKEMVRANEQVVARRALWLEAQEAADILENLKFTLGRKQATCQSLVGLLMAEMGAQRDPSYNTFPPTGSTGPQERPVRAPARRK